MNLQTIFDDYINITSTNKSVLNTLLRDTVYSTNGIIPSSLVDTYSGASLKFDTSKPDMYQLLKTESKTAIDRSGINLFLRTYKDIKGSSTDITEDEFNSDYASMLPENKLSLFNKSFFNISKAGYPDTDSGTVMGDAANKILKTLTDAAVKPVAPPTQFNKKPETIPEYDSNELAYLTTPDKIMIDDSTFVEFNIKMMMEKINACLFGYLFLDDDTDEEKLKKKEIRQAGHHLFEDDGVTPKKSEGLKNLAETLIKLVSKALAFFADKIKIITKSIEMSKKMLENPTDTGIVDEFNNMVKKVKTTVTELSSFTDPNKFSEWVFNKFGGDLKEMSIPIPGIKIPIIPGLLEITTPTIDRDNKLGWQEGEGSKPFSPISAIMNFLKDKVPPEVLAKLIDKMPQAPFTMDGLLKSITETLTDPDILKLEGGFPPLDGLKTWLKLPMDIIKMLLGLPMQMLSKLIAKVTDTLSGIVQFDFDPFKKLMETISDPMKLLDEVIQMTLEGLDEMLGKVYVAFKTLITDAGIDIKKDFIIMTKSTSKKVQDVIAKLRENKEPSDWGLDASNEEKFQAAKSKIDMALGLLEMIIKKAFICGPKVILMIITEITNLVAKIGDTQLVQLPKIPF